MQAVSKISFKNSETNLLKNAVTLSESQPKTQTPPPKIEVNTQTQPDVFENKAQNTKSFLKEYGGITALAVSILGIPATYVVTKRASTKNLDNVQTALKELTEKFNKLDIESKIKAAVEESLKKTNTPQQMVSKKSALVTTLLGIGTGTGIIEFLRNNHKELKEMGYTDDEITEAKNTASNLVENPQKAMNKADQAYHISTNIDSKAQRAETAANQARGMAQSISQEINDVRKRADEALGAIRGEVAPQMEKFVTKYYDLWLMQYPGWEKKINNQRTELTMSTIRNAGEKRLNRTDEDTIKDIRNYQKKYDGKLTSLWSLTAEFKPIKLGGLGEVPVDLQDNFTKLGIDAPTFIPMYEAQGVSRFISESPSTSKYIYGNKVYNLNKVASMLIDVFRENAIHKEKVEFYETVENGKKLIFIKNQNFEGSIYDSTPIIDEPEKFAIFTKAVYSLAKAKVADALGENLSAGSMKKYPAYNDIQAPNSMILNDWHAATMAGLLRYRAAMEYNYNELNKDTFDALTNMPLLMIGHNLKVQGASNGANKNIPANNAATQNIINTLYDKFAVGIVENANSGIDNDDLSNTVLLKRTTADKQFNSLFHGIALADWFVPVSKNYANEIVDDVMQSGITRPLLQRRKATGTLEGIINGTDLVKHNMHAVSKKNFVENLVLKEYDKNTDINTIMEFRNENKRRFFDKFVNPILKGTKDTPELINPNIGRRDITEEEFMEAPLISFAHRLTDQKGLSLLKGAIFRLFDNWEAEFGDQPKPFFIVGGPPESQTEVNYLYDLKNPDYGNDKSRLDYVIALKGNMPNPALMSASTFFCAPSTFEPCGLTQGECFAKGTPIIATDTGGYHDTIVDGVTGFLAPQISEESVYKTLVRALKTYYFDNEAYKQMVKNDLAIDFSWARGGKKGPIYEYTDKLGYNRKKLPDIAINENP